MKQVSYTKTTLLTTQNHKTIKGSAYGYITYILYLSSFTNNSKGINICSHASLGCSTACLVGSGMGGMYSNVKNGRINKTEYWLGDRKNFLLQLDAEIMLAKVKNAGKAIVTIRLNGTSDIPFEKFIVRDGKNIFELHSDIQFYDYTKNYMRFEKELPKNYHLTFSRSEINGDKCFDILKKGFNVAMVFENKLPKTYKGYKVVNGDETDLRFLDKKNVIVGLKYKKLTSKGIDNKEVSMNGFVIKVAA